MSDTNTRSFTKAFCWRIVGAINLFVISYLIIDEPLKAGGIAFAEFFTGIVLYYIHERIWNRISWGTGEKK